MRPFISRPSRLSCPHTHLRPFWEPGRANHTNPGLLLDGENKAELTNPSLFAL